MKSFYPKGKGRIHPSPGSPSAAAAPAVDALALLPAAILLLTAALGDEDKEVLAYLITRSINGPAAALAGEDRVRRGRGGGAHRPMFDCGCFECYTSFWSRWDCSPDREVISQAIDAFEEQLESSERRGGGGGGGGTARSRRRERRAAEKGKNSKKEKKKAGENEDKSAVYEEEKVVSLLSESCSAAEEKAAGEEEEAAVRDGENKEEEAASGNGMEIVAVEQPERRRGWPDLMGLLNSRLWSLWSPGACG